MKKLIFTFVLLAFGVAAHAAEPKCCAGMPACADKAKTCPFAKSDSKKDVAACEKSMAACCQKGEASGKRVVQSPKAAAEARK
jgi:hypothetical protein